MSSGYTVQRGGASGGAAIRGSFWADPETHDLLRLEFHADEIPPELRYADVSTTIYYNRVRIGESDVLLPRTADMRTIGVDGVENHNLIEFTHCQGFHAESTLVFGAAHDATPVAGPAATPLSMRTCRMSTATTAPRCCWSTPTTSGSGRTKCPA